MGDSEHSDSVIDVDSFLLTAIAFELGLGLLGLFFGWMVGSDPRTLIPKPTDIQSISLGIGLGCVAALPMLGLVYALEFLRLPGIERISRLTKDQLLRPIRDISTINLIAIAIAAGVGEELLFRGWLQGWLIGPLETASILQISVGILATSILFGLVHPITPTYVALAATMGVYLGILAIATSNLLIPIAAHAFYDAIQLIIARREASQTPDESSSL